MAKMVSFETAILLCRQGSEDVSVFYELCTRVLQSKICTKWFHCICRYIKKYVCILSDCEFCRQNSGLQILL